MLDPTKYYLVPGEPSVSRWVIEQRQFRFKDLNLQSQLKKILQNCLLDVVVPLVQLDKLLQLLDLVDDLENLLIPLPPCLRQEEGNQSFLTCLQL